MRSIYIVGGATGKVSGTKQGRVNRPYEMQNVLVHRKKKQEKNFLSYLFPQRFKTNNLIGYFYDKKVCVLARKRKKSEYLIPS